MRCQIAVKCPGHFWEKPATAIAPSNQGTESRLDLRVSELLANIIGVSADEITTTTKLGSLGVDSLLVTEVLREIRKQFHVVITPSEFFNCDDIRSLCACIHTGTVREEDTFTQTCQTRGRESCDGLVSQPIAPYQSINSSQPNLELGLGFAMTCQSYFTNVNDTYEKHAEATGYRDFYANIFPIQFELVTRCIIEAFKPLGADLPSILAGEEVAVVTCIPKHRRLVQRLYGILQVAGLVVQEENGVIRRTAKDPPTSPSSVLFSTLLSKFPQHNVETKLLHSTAHWLAECLTGKEDPVGILFGSLEARAMLEDMYTNSPMFKTGTLLLADYIPAIMKSYEGTGRQIQILEIGAGTGGTTKLLLEALVKSASTRHPTYTFSDISTSLVHAARRKFTLYPFMKYEVLDVEQSPTFNAAERYNQFDIISTNWVHATRSLVDLTRSIRRFFKSDGILCLLEMTRNIHWFDLAFGSLDGWWLAADGRQHPLANESRWKNDRGTAGYRWVRWSEGNSEESEVFRLISASPSDAFATGICGEDQASLSCFTQDTMAFKKVGNLTLHADMYYPQQARRKGIENPIAPVGKSCQPQ